MKIKRSECVDCGLPCLGRACKYNEVERTLCDFCLEYNNEENDAEYSLDGVDLCYECLMEAIIEYIKDELTIDEIKDKLGLNIERI